MKEYKTNIPAHILDRLPQTLANEYGEWDSENNVIWYDDLDIVYDINNDTIHDIGTWIKYLEFRESKNDNHIIYEPPDDNVYKSDLCVSTTAMIIIHADILDICKDIYTKINKNEFSIVVKGEWDKNNWSIYTNEYAIPKQTVDIASVDYDLDDLLRLKQEGFNTVIHGHPAGCNMFSADDMQYINAHFACSILFHVDSFIKACIPIQVTNDFLYQLITQDIFLYNPGFKPVDAGKFNNIKVKQVKPVTKVMRFGNGVNR